MYSQRNHGDGLFCLCRRAGIRNRDRLLETCLMALLMVLRLHPIVFCTTLHELPLASIRLMAS